MQSVDWPPFCSLIMSFPTCTHSNVMWTQFEQKVCEINYAVIRPLESRTLVVTQSWYHTTSERMIGQPNEYSNVSHTLHCHRSFYLRAQNDNNKHFGLRKYGKFAENAPKSEYKRYTQIWEIKSERDRDWDCATFVYICRFAWFHSTIYLNNVRQAAVFSFGAFPVRPCHDFVFANEKMFAIQNTRRERMDVGYYCNIQR